MLHTPPIVLNFNPMFVQSNNENNKYGCYSCIYQARKINMEIVEASHVHPPMWHIVEYNYPTRQSTKPRRSCLVQWSCCITKRGGGE